MPTDRRRPQLPAAMGAAIFLLVHRKAQWPPKGTKPLRREPRTACLSDLRLHLWAVLASPPGLLETHRSSGVVTEQTGPKSSQDKVGGSWSWTDRPALLPVTLRSGAEGLKTQDVNSLQLANHKIYQKHKLCPAFFCFQFVLIFSKFHTLTKDPHPT